MADYRLPTKCTNPDCKEKHAGKLTVHAPCHVDAPFKVLLYGDVVSLICSECNSFVQAFRATGIVPMEEVKALYSSKVN
jgi:hypothetical protein